jgi:hypothetical protein
VAEAHIDRGSAAYEPPDFEGHEPRRCRDHRTVGPHRAWCHDCGEWCYPDSPCPGCAIVLPRPTVQAALDLLGYVGDHGGGERRHMIGDRPAPVDTACPSCRANLLADELREAL